MATATTPNQVRALNSPPVVISLRAKRDRPNSQDRCRNSHFPPSFACLQDFDEIIAILKSKKNPRGIKVAVSALLWGEDYYASCDDSEKVVQGEIDRWQGPDKAVLMIRWTGYSRCQAAPLSTLRRAANGELLNFVLIPGPNGALPTRDIEPAAPPPPPPRENPSPAGLAAAPQPATDELRGGIEVGTSFWSGMMKWKRLVPEGIRVDSRGEKPRYKPKLNSGGKTLNTIEALFYHLLPEKWIDLVLTYTNPLLDGRDEINKKLTKGEFLRFMGYCISLSIHSGIPLHKMWSKTPLPDSTAPPPAMGRFGISQNRFDKVRSVFRCGPSDDASFDANDWCFCEGLVDAFNDHNQHAVIAGWLLGADESISAWRGKVGKRNPKKCPHRMFVKRKPEPLGVEFKNIGDALSGIMLFMEITKGKAEIVKPKYYSKEVGATAATTLRLSEPWFGTDRVVTGDSWFAGVKTLRLMKENGLDFIGDVKTSTKDFVPKGIYQEETADENGAWATWESSIELGGSDKEVPIFAVSHRRGESIHCFISSCGTTLPGNAHYAYLEDDEERAMAEIEEYELTRKCPRVLNDFTLAQPTIDRHNRYRQHILAMEKRLVTNNFSFRFFITLLAIVVVNAFFAHRYFNDPTADFKSLCDRLAIKLMNNPWIESPTASPSASCAARAKSACDDCDVHELVPLRSVLGDKWKCGAQQRCMLCDSCTTWVCRQCTTGPASLVPLCPETTIPRNGPLKGTKIHHACLGKHQVSPNFFPKGKTTKTQARRKRARQDGADSGSEEVEE